MDDSKPVSDDTVSEKTRHRYSTQNHPDCVKVCQYLRENRDRGDKQAQAIWKRLMKIPQILSSGRKVHTGCTGIG